MMDTITKQSGLWQVWQMRSNSMFLAKNREIRDEEGDIYKESARKPKWRFDLR